MSGGDRASDRALAPSGPNAAARGEVPFELKERAMDEAPIGITIADATEPGLPLVYVNDAFVRLTGYDRSFSLGRNCRFLQGDDTSAEVIAEMATAIDEETPVTVEVKNYRRNGEPFWNEVTIAPLENEDGEVTHYVGFQSDITERVAAERSLEAERQSLATLLERIEGLLEGVTKELLEPFDKEGLKQAVCRQVVETTPFDPVWIGDRDYDTDRVDSIAVATDEETGTELSVSLARNPAVEEAIEEDQLRICHDLELDSTEVWSGDVAVVPLGDGDRSFGVLFVHAGAAGAFDDRETAVLESLGRMVGTALSALESRRIITSDNIVEIVLAIGDDEFFLAELAGSTEAAFEFEGSISRHAAPTAFFTTDADPAEIVEQAAAVDDIEAVNVVSEDAGRSLLEIRLSQSSFLADLADLGAQTVGVSSDGRSGRVEIELPARSNPRRVVEHARDRYRSVDLLQYRERERPPSTKQEFVAEVRDRLSDRQLDALERAYLGGYYDRERGTDGDELADSMDISRPTFHQHRRAAERHILEAFFEN